MANIKISELNPLLTVQDADVLPIVDNGVTKKVTAAILQSYTQGNSVLLTGAQTIAGIKTFTSQLASSVATGTAPFSVASTTKVTNLNADLLDGLSSADFQATLSGTGIVKSTAGTISYLTDNTANWDTAYNDKINSAAVTGSGTNTLTLTQQDAGTITATWVNGTLIREVRNTTGATLTKGTIVYISGATGNKPTVTKAIATGDSTSAQTFGFIQSDLANNANGYVVVVGDLTGVDTSAFNEGDQLYLSSTVAGAFTSTKQYAPAHLVYVGIVTRSHPTLGQIEVNIQNGYELDELHNVSAQSPSNGDILQFVTSTGLWTKVAGTTTNISEGTNLYFTNARSRSAISLTTTGTSGAATYNSTTGVLNVPNYADGGITSLNGLTALTQTFSVGTSGTDFGISSATSTHTFNLPTASATNRGALSSADWTTFNSKQDALTNPITGTGTTNYLPKFTGTSALGNSIISDNGSIVSIGGALTTTGNIQISRNTESTFLRNTNSSGDFFLGIDSSTGSTFGNGNYSRVIYSAGAYPLDFWTNDLVRMRITPTGNVGIGTTSPYSKLQVTTATNENVAIGSLSAIPTGRTLILQTDAAGGSIETYSSLTSGYVPLLLNPNGANVGIGTTSPAAKLDVDSTGYSIFANNSNGNRIVKIGTQSASGEPAIQATLSNGTARYLMLNPDGGNILIGTTGDAGYKLDVNGTARIQGQLAVNHSLSGNYGAIIYNTSATGEGLVVRGGSTASHTSFAVQPYDGSVSLFSVVASGAATFSADATINGVKVGKGAGSIATNTAVGASALNANTIGTNNTAIGNSALIANTTAVNNTAIGSGALVTNVTGANNTAIGTSALALNISANNTAIGRLCLSSNSSGTANTAVGVSALQANTTSNNVAFGFEAAKANTSATGITAIGYQSLLVNTTGVSNTAVGIQTLTANTTGANNTAIGKSALIANTTGFSNTAIGESVLLANVSGTYNVAIGSAALSANVSGSNNIAIGRVALQNNTASNNVAIGFEAANANTSGLQITAIGYQALKAHTTATGSTAIGYQALTANTASYNTAIGWSTLSSNTTGADLVAIGANQQSGNFTGVSMIGILDTATGNNQMRFGSTAVVNGAVTTETNTSSKVWNVFINGVAQKILLA